MANSFKDLELLMDNNLTRVSASSSTLLSSSSVAIPSSITASTIAGFNSSSGSYEHEQISYNSNSVDYSNARHSFAALSLAVGPVIAPSLIPNPNLDLTKRSQNPTPRCQQVVSDSKALSSLKKCISPTLLMPAITAATIAPESVSNVSSVAAAKKSSAFPDYLRLPDKNNNFKEPTNGAAMRRASIVWFRNDLRCHDNEALSAANKESLSVLPVYCFDPRDYGKSSSGFDKTGPYRAKFLLECVSNLRDNLRERGSDLIVRVGKPEEILVDLAKCIGADGLYAHQEVSCEEVRCEQRVSAALEKEGIDVKYFWGSTLFHLEDLPFKIEDMPITYSGFREKVQNVGIRQSLETPKQSKGLPVVGNVKAGNIPTLQELGLRSVSAQQDGSVQATTPALIGGEVEALRRLNNFVVDHVKQLTSKTGSGACGDSLYGSNFSCKISPWLAMGCLSPRRMFEELKSNVKSTMSTSASTSASSCAKDNGLNWLVFELLWRDFFRFITKKYAASKGASEVVTASLNTAAVPA